jgi:predicted enzyme related to lactoylglutathione lyase
MSTLSSHAEVPFAGDLDLIKQFYEMLGITVSNGVLTFERFEIFFGNELGIEHFQIAIDVDVDLSRIESQIAEKGGTIIESGFDMSGPFIIARDPAGLRVRIGMSQHTLARVG